MGVGLKYKDPVSGDYITVGRGPAGISSWGGITGDIANQTDLQAALDAKEDATAVQPSPIQYYGARQVLIGYPGAGDTGVNGDPAIADDRNGPTGKIWMFYFNNQVNKLLRVEIPYIGCPASEIGAPVDTGLTGRVNHFVEYNGEWYVGCVNQVYKFATITDTPTLLSTISTAGSNGDQSFVANLCINRHTNGTWYAWYSTYNGTVVGIRRATASSPSGPWTIASGMWMTPTQVNSSLTWLRIFHVITDSWGRMWAVAGAGKRWGGSGNPGMDDEASVWMAEMTNITDKPATSDWRCIIDPPYFETDKPATIAPFNNVYAPTFIQDGNTWYMYINSGKYAAERIIEMRGGLPNGWSIPIGTSSAGDVQLTSSYAVVTNSKAYVIDGLYKIDFTGSTFLYHSSAEWHTVRLRMIDTATSEVLSEYQIQNGDRAYESRPLPNLSAIVRATEAGRTIAVEARYEVGSGQVTPTKSVLRSMVLTVTRMAD